METFSEQSPFSVSFEKLAVIQAPTFAIYFIFETYRRCIRDGARSAAVAAVEAAT